MKNYQLKNCLTMYPENRVNPSGEADTLDCLCRLLRGQPQAYSLSESSGVFEI